MKFSRLLWKTFVAMFLFSALSAGAQEQKAKQQDSTRAQSEQANRQERWRFYSPSTPLSDDPRRVPVPPGPHGSSGTLVLRGGRIFDGTGAPAREGTLVIS
jgi:hypothetical protein